MTDRARRSWFSGLLALLGGVVIVAGSFLTWLKVPGGVSVETVSVTGTPKGSELLLGQVAIGAGAAVIILGLLLPAIRSARRLLGFLVIVGAVVAIAAAYWVASSPRDRYIDFAVQKAAPASKSDEVRASLANLFEVSGQEVDLGVGLYVVIGGGALSVVGGLGALLGRRKAKPVEEAAELPEPDRLAKEWLAAREQEAAARSAAFEEAPKPELVTQPAGPSPSTQPPEPDVVTEPVGAPRMTDRARRSWVPSVLAVIGGGVIVGGCYLTWLHVGGGVSVRGFSITGTPKGNELLAGKEALVDGIAVVFLGLLLLVNRDARPLSRTLLGLLVVAGGIFAVAIAAYVVSSPRDRYIDFALQRGALAGQTDEVNHSLIDLFDVSGQKADLGVGLFVVIGGGVLSVVGGLAVVTDRRKPTSVDEVHEPSGPEPEGLPEEWLAARAEEAAARSAALARPPEPEVVTQPAGPPLPTQPPEPEPVTQLAGPPPMPKAPEPELVSQPAGPPPPTEPQEPELVTQPAGPPPPADRPKPDVRAAWTKPLPDEWAAKAPVKGRRRRRS
jgi:hypothetical protein